MDYQRSIMQYPWESSLRIFTNFISWKDRKKKLGIILTARVHPGETVGSFMMKGAINFLTSNHPNAIQLRETFLFFLVPMLNPDGVVVGNNRYGLDGSDLNRKFRSPTKVKLHTLLTKCRVSNKPFSF